MEDYIVRATAGNGQLRAFAATTANLVEQARAIHGTSPVATAALGRLLTAGAMMGAMMKGERDLLTLQIKGSGALGGIVVTADSKANVKGYVHEPVVLLPPNEKGKLDVSGAIGPGILNVIKDLGMKEPYSGQVALQTGEIAEDLTYYFAVSEQVPSTVGLGVLMNRDNTVCQAGGFIIQVMPFAEESTIASLEQKLGQVTGVTDLLNEGLSPEQILEMLTGSLGLQITDRMPAAYHCGCSRERMLRALASIGRKDLEELAAAGEPVEMSCHFCNTRYTFSGEEISELLNRNEDRDGGIRTE